MATSTHVGDTRALVFPVLCDGHLKIEYDDYNSNDLVGSNTIDTSKHPLWDYGGPFSIEAIITPYDVNGIGHRTSGQGRLDSTKTPPSPNLSLDDQADTTSNYESVSYFGAGRSTHKMMIFSNSYLKFYLQNTTSSNFNQPAEYKMVVEITDSVGTPITHTIDTDAAVFTSKKSLTGYYDADGFYNGITTDKTKITASATGSLPSATAQITGDLASFTNTASIPATLGTATFTIDAQPGSSHLDTPGSSGTAPTGDITVDSLSASDCFSEFGEENDGVTNTLESVVNNKSIKIFNDGTTAADTFVFVPVLASNLTGSAKNGSNLTDVLTGTGGAILPTSGIPNNNIFIFAITNTSSGGNWQNANNLRTVIGTSSLSANITGLNLYSPSLSGKTVNLTTTLSTSTSTFASYNNTITRGSNLTSDVTVNGMSGGVNAASGSNVNYYMTVQLRNSIGNLVTKYFKFFNTGTNGAVNNSTTSVSPTHIVRLGSDANGTASNLSGAINSAFSGTNFAGPQASVSGSVVTVTSPSTSNVANQALARVSNYSSVVSVSGSQFGNYVAETPAVTPTAFITLEDSSGTIKKYKPTKGANNENNGSTATEGSNAVVFFTNVVGDTATTADNLRAVIAGSSGHNGTLTVSRVGSTVTIVAASAGDQAISSTGISSGLSLGAFSTNVRNITVGSGEADGIGAGNSIYDNTGTLIGTVSSVSGNSITLAADPATTVTSTIYRDQQKEALYLEQIAKVGISFNKNTLTFYLNNQPVKRVKVNIGKFRLGTSDCYIGQDGSLNATNRKATQFMGELYEIAFHKSANPCASITTLTPNFSDTLLYYTFGD